MTSARNLLLSSALVFLLAACAQAPLTGSDNAPSSPDAQSRLHQGLERYKESRFDAALADLNAAVASGKLSTADEINARKHAAFIHCMSNREAPCREQFQAILKTDPSFDLAANEASHPSWGPVWRSIKVVLDDQRTVARGSGFLAGPGLQKLAEGIKEYDAGRYKEAIVALQASIKSGLKDKADQVRAHKFSAFAYCLNQNTAQCRASFRTLFELDPAFELVPSEAGHPAWSAIYKRELAAAKRARAKPVKASAPAAAKK